MATENNNKTLNVPNLRFPVFSGEWETSILLDVCEINPKTPSLDDEFVYIDLESVEKGTILHENVISRDDAPSRAQRVLKFNDILFQCVRPYQKNNLLFAGDTRTLQYVASTGYAQIRTDKQNPAFLYQLLNTQKFVDQVMLRCTGTSYPAINANDLSKIPICYPLQIEEQNKIAKLLSLLDNRIATQIKIIEKLESLIKGLYERFFNIDGAAYIQLGDVAKIQKGQQINGEELSESGSYYVMNGGVVPSGYLEDFNTSANTISISEGGNSCGYVQYNGVPFWSGGHCYTLTEPINSFNYKYLFHYLKFKEQSIMALRIGSGLPNIQKKDLERFPILNVSKEDQDTMVCIFDEILEKIVCERQIAIKYEEQKRYLLSKLFI